MELKRGGAAISFLTNSTGASHVACVCCEKKKKKKMETVRRGTVYVFGFPDMRTAENL